MSDVETLPKDGYNDFHKYKFTSEKAIKEAIHPLMVKHGVILQIEVLSSSQFGEKTTQKGSAKDYCTNASIKYTWWDVESGESMSGTFIGFGEDTGDKGIYKAITGAIKYILTSTFLIPTGDDPEFNAKKKPIAAQQRAAPAPIDPALLPACVCGRGRKYVPAGVTKAGKAFSGFYPCISNKEQQTPECRKHIIWEEYAEDVAAQSNQSLNV